MRGRWTVDQKTFINRLKVELGAGSAGEIIRHIVAWYLTVYQGGGGPARPSAPAEAFSVKREVRLEIMDFLTTPEQAAAIKAAAIKAAACGIGEAAWMRQAVDVYRIHGPVASGTLRQ